MRWPDAIADVIDPELLPEGFVDDDASELDPEDLSDPQAGLKRDVRGARFVTSLGPAIADYQRWLEPGGPLAMATRQELDTAAAAAGLNPYDLHALARYMYDYAEFGRDGGWAAGASGAQMEGVMSGNGYFEYGEAGYFPFGQQGYFDYGAPVGDGDDFFEGASAGTGSFDDFGAPLSGPEAAGGNFGAARGTVDEPYAYELVSAAESAPELANQRQSIRDNLARKKKRGVYDHDKVPKLMEYLVNNADKWYHTSGHPSQWHQTKGYGTNVPTRRAAAQQLADRYLKGEFGADEPVTNVAEYQAFGGLLQDLQQMVAPVVEQVAFPEGGAQSAAAQQAHETLFPTKAAERAAAKELERAEKRAAKAEREAAKAARREEKRRKPTFKIVRGASVPGIQAAAKSKAGIGGGAAILGGAALLGFLAFAMRK